MDRVQFARHILEPPIAVAPMDEAEKEKKEVFNVEDEPKEEEKKEVANVEDEVKNEEKGENEPKEEEKKPGHWYCCWLC